MQLLVTLSIRLSKHLPGQICNVLAGTPFGRARDMKNVWVSSSKEGRLNIFFLPTNPSTAGMIERQW